MFRHMLKPTISLNFLNRGKTETVKRTSRHSLFSKFYLVASLKEKMKESIFELYYAFEAISEAEIGRDKFMKQ